MKRLAWMLAATLVTSTSTTSWAQRASLPSATSVPVREIGVGPASTPLSHPRPLPDTKPSSAPLPNPAPAPAKEAPRPAPAAAVLGHPVEEMCCGQARMCECPMCLLKRRLTTRFRHLLGGCPCCCCCCDPPSLAEAVATRIRAEEACAPSRLCAVRYLGTVDCHYYPEAEEALIASLRCDRNHCVRLEAACALGSGCCCTPRVIEALTLVVAGSEADGNPCENCDDVRRAAFNSLQKLLACHEASCASQDVAEPTGHAGRLALAAGRARLTMARVAGAGCPTGAYRCPPPVQRNLLDLVASAARARHADCDSPAGERYFPMRPASEAMVVVGIPGPFPSLFYGHAEQARPAFDLPARPCTPSASVPHAPTGQRPALSKSLGNTKENALTILGGGTIKVAADSGDAQVLPVLMPVGAIVSAALVERPARSLLPPGLTPLGKVPEEDDR